ncbi:MurR/RpiR family transcriptional regulator [Streptococcus mutans]|uniref:MurR/RpiR family transcriptional regulator n=1 Tax=Streptococcus mutans TaxID=1309 RepID=UPI0002B4DE3C|nr:MurR/RpiR family transcriptional regulator [Streptococcus mutans]EMB67081.1 putative transcriptional regulator [Streptococcus mutans 2ST1]EMB67863.1 putative transcriptional regulator [Streptococcus mutans 3SN1]EMC20230.1 putative transcriptional regulator [Streptococcus mutans SF1]EMC37354.1 putative transcriptional regulator [Streptococcus mutans 21]MCB4962434.1 MurR/RpiR family transcriptional regulator [Streptococcus mutans]
MKNNKKLTETEEYTWQYITRDFNEIGKLNISELSQAINVSNATIIRTLKKKGYGGFSEFKHEIEQKKNNSLHVLTNKSLKKDTRRSIIKNYQEVMRTLNTLDVTAIEESILMIEKAQRIIIFARGFSELIASEMLVKFQLLNKYCELHTDPNIIRPVSARLTSKDLVLFISLNGETVALVDAARNCIKNRVKTILLSASESSSLAHLTSLQLIGFKTELSYFPDYEVHSRLPLSILSRILLDAYAASLIE